MGKCPAGEGIPSPSQKPPPPGSAPSPATSNAVCPSEGRGRERACRSEPPPRPRAPVGPERQDGPEDHRAAERGAQLPLTWSARSAARRSDARPTLRSALPAATQHDQPGRGPPAGAISPETQAPSPRRRPTARDASSTHPVAAAMFAQSQRHVK